MIFTAATVQFRPVWGAPEKNLNSLLSLCRIASQRGAELIVLPEMCLSGYLFNDINQIRNIAEPADGETFSAFAGHCVKNSCYISYGFPEKAGDRLYNSQNLIGPDGKLLMRYRKTHLFDADMTWAAPGDLGFMAAETPLGVMGMGICMDLNYDDFLRFHIDSGTDLLLFAANWLDQGFDVLEYWESRLREFEGTVFISNRYGFEDGVFFSGRSAVYKKGSYLSAASKTGNAVLFTCHETAGEKE